MSRKRITLTEELVGAVRFAALMKSRLSEADRELVISALTLLGLSVRHSRRSKGKIVICSTPQVFMHLDWLRNELVAPTWGRDRLEDAVSLTRVSRDTAATRPWMSAIAAAHRRHSRAAS